MRGLECVATLVHLWGVVHKPPHPEEPEQSEGLEGRNTHLQAHLAIASSLIRAILSICSSAVRNSILGSFWMRDSNAARIS